MIKKQGKRGAAPEKASGENTLEHYLVLFGRFCAWALLVFIILYFISGFGITKSGLMYQWTGGLMDKTLAFRLHNRLVLPTAFAAICHVLIAVRYAMIRWKVRNMKMLNMLFIGAGVVLFALASAAYLA